MASYFIDQYGSAVGKGYISLPSGSHNAARMTNDDRDDTSDSKALLIFVLTQPGVPIIYYGDEIGGNILPASPKLKAVVTISLFLLNCRR